MLNKYHLVLFVADAGIISTTFKSMSAQYAYNIFACGDSAITIDFGSVIDDDVNAYALRLFHHLKQKNIPGVKDVIPAYSSITVVYDVMLLYTKAKVVAAFEYMRQTLQNILSEELPPIPISNRLIQIPACYDRAFAPDPAEIAEQKNMQPEDVIELHCSKTYRVYMLGYLPGFAYMGIIDEQIATPRRATPRTKVPAGSIGIAGNQTGIYPFESPGGWNIIAQTPFVLFDATKQQPAILQPGDTVQFYPVTPAEFNKIKATQ